VEGKARRERERRIGGHMAGGLAPPLPLNCAELARCARGRNGKLAGGAPLPGVLADDRKGFRVERRAGHE